MPRYVISQTPHKVILRNFEGVITTYTEPDNYQETCQCEYCRGEREGRLVGVAGLERGQSLSLEPKGLARTERCHGGQKGAAHEE